MITIRLQKRRSSFELNVEQNIHSLPLAIFGPSGAGKSTILKSIAGLEHPDSGFIAINGKTLFDSDENVNLPPENRNIGYVPQDGLLFPHLTVEQNLLYGYVRIKNRKRSIELNEVCSVLEMDHLLERNVKTLSGGENQRVSLGRALLTSPELLLFDEPLASVDQRLKNRILPYLIRAITHFNIPTIYVSHNHEEVTQIAKNIMVLNEGKVVACGNYLEIIDNPDVYSTFSRQGVDNAFKAEIIENQEHEGLTIVEADEAQFCVPPLDAHPGENVSLNIRANDIILASEKPVGISTRNVLEAQVIKIADVGNIYLVHIDVGCELIVELTPSAQNELQIEVGKTLWCLIKTNAFSVGRITI